jgi:hypothetical protein
MEKKQWLWLFVVFSILNLTVFAISFFGIVVIPALYNNIIRAVLAILALYALFRALSTKKIVLNK